MKEYKVTVNGVAYQVQVEEVSTPVQTSEPVAPIPNQPQDTLVSATPAQPEDLKNNPTTETTESQAPRVDSPLESTTHPETTAVAVDLPADLEEQPAKAEKSNSVTVVEEQKTAAPDMKTEEN